MEQDHIYITEESRITYVSSGTEIWALDTDDLAILGEYTNESGPDLDDYCLILVSRKGLVYEIPNGMNGFLDVVQDLEKQLGAKWLGQLMGSTTMDSCVNWPPSLSGEPIFEFTTCRPRGILSAFLWMLGIREVEGALSNKIKAYLDTL